LMNNQVWHIDQVSQENAQENARLLDWKRAR
jgi:hypothetical protein